MDKQIKMAGKKFNSIDEYHKSVPSEAREKLDKIRETVLKVAPQLKEVISYNIPAFKGQGLVLYYAAFKNHVSIYPVPRGKEWEKEFEKYYTSGKGTLQFPLDKPIPVTLVKKVLKFRLQEDEKRALAKKAAKKTVKKAAAKKK